MAEVWPKFCRRTSLRRCRTLGFSGNFFLSLLSLLCLLLYPVSMVHAYDDQVTNKRTPASIVLRPPRNDAGSSYFGGHGHPRLAHHDRTFWQRSRKSPNSTELDGLDIIFRGRLKENSGVGAEVVEYSGVYKKQKTTAQNVTYKIRHESDLMRQFDIGQQDGVLRVVKPLDREKIPEYRLIVEAKDTAGNSGNTSATILLTDVNDNAPELQYDPSRFTVYENRVYGKADVLGYVTAIDPDGPDNGPPFHMQHLPNSSTFSLFKVDFDQEYDNNKGGVSVRPIGPFDREGSLGKVLYIELAVKDNGQPPMGAIRYLPIVIGDINDNPMTDGASTIYIYNYNAQLSSGVVGQVFVEDLDDWDSVHKIFTLKSGSVDSGRYFRVDNQGMINMQSKTPPGTYTLEVEVEDKSRREMAAGTVTVVLEYLTHEAVENSGSIRIKGFTPESFLRSSRNEAHSPYETFRNKVAASLQVSVEKVQIFSVQSAKNVKPDSPRPIDQILDVHFAVLRNSPYFAPALLHGLLTAHKPTFERALGATILKINIDPCLDETCATGACHRRLTVDRDPLFVMSNRSSLVGVTLNVEGECSVERFTLPPKCSASVCLNNGICHNIKGANGTAGFFCECRASGRGSRCEGKTRSFHGDGYAWLKPIASSNNFSVSFEFLTRSSNAILLYNGPMIEKASGDDSSSQDFLAVRIVDGFITVNVDLGSGETILKLNNKLNRKVNDGQWHTVDIFMQPGARVLSLLLDRCQNITASSRISSNVLPQCQATAPTNGPNEQLNLDTPLQLGGVAKVDGPSFRFLRNLTSNFDGCVRNLKIDGQLYDLLSVLKSEYSTPGCEQTAYYCETTSDESQGYCHQGECVASLDGQRKCVCDPGFHGERCESEGRWKTFKKNALVRYHITEPLPHSWTKARLLFVRNHDLLDDGQLMRAENNQRSKNSVINLVNKRVGYEFLADRPGEQYEVRPILSLQPNVAYTVELEQFWRFASVSVDGLFDQTHAARRLPSAANLLTAGELDDRSLIDYDPHGIYLGGYSTPLLSAASSSSWVAHSSVFEEFQGCIRDFVFDDLPLIVAGDNAHARAVDVRDVVDGCPLLVACASLQCPSTMICVDAWKGAICTCPKGAAPIWHDANDGTLAACTESVAALRVGITSGAVAAILISLLALLILLLILVVYSRRRRKPPSIQEDLISRENVRGYNEEGGGEEDQDNYNIGPLRKPVLPSEDWPQATPIVSNERSKLKPTAPLEELRC